MSILFGLYQADSGKILVNGKEVHIKDPNDANKYGIGMDHQHFKLVEVFTVLENIILGCETVKFGFLQFKEAREKVMELSKKYGLYVDPDALVEDITVGMQQRTEILRMLYKNNDILIFDEPTAVLTPQEIDELMKIMKELAKDGKSILFISHKLNEIMKVADRCTILRKGKYIDTVDIKDVDPEKLSELMVGRKINLVSEKAPASPKETVLEVKDLVVKDKIHGINAVNHASLKVRAGEIVCIAGIDGNGQHEFINAVTGLMPIESGHVILNGEDISNKSIRYKNTHGMSHIPEDRHKHGLVLDYTLEQNIVLQRYFEDEFQTAGFIKDEDVREYANRLIEQYDVRSGQGPITISRTMSGGNQQKAIIARELDRKHNLLIAVQPTRGLDVGAIEYIHNQIIKSRDSGAAVLLVSFELEEVMNLSDRILVMHNGEIVGEFDPKKTDIQELGLYMAGAKRQNMGETKESAV